MASDTLSNAQVRDVLARYVTDTYLTGGDPTATIGVGPLEVNCFSICFWITASSPTRQRGVYVKIPKVVCYDKSRERIMPFSPDDTELAEDEYRSLVLLSRDWPSDDIGVHFVKPLGFIKDYNAIVTERFHAEHLFEKLRRYERRRTPGTPPDPVHEALSRFGRALSRFHGTSVTACTVDGKAIVEKMQRCCSQLLAYGVRRKVVANIVQELTKARDLGGQSECTHTLKGIDVRQVFIDDTDALFVLDPGKTKPGYREADLARFIVTCRIVYWGSLMLLVRGVPHASYEESFLDGYYGDRARPVYMLRLLIVKELLKHWRMAHAVLAMRHWPALLKLMLRKAYVDPFYKRQLQIALANLGR